MHIKTDARIFISLGAKQALLLDVSARRTIEACGVLIGSIDEAGNWHVESIHPLRNIFDSPTYFEFAPEELLAADLAYPGQVIGVYHSHPTGFAKPSQTDRQNMKRVNISQRIPWAWLIVCGPFQTSSLDTKQAEPAFKAEATILAFHHYADDGLCSIPLLIAPEV
ncbi:MAG TPA: Mov34/MPN/PAD-1 family protein [Ktedonobacteraceae bacterium]|nr:Mov34/MPN/PAD-1 family protein [Ktedonobacteraceae bacterium]